MQTVAAGVRSVKLVVRLNADALIYSVATIGGLVFGAWLGMELLALTLPR